MAHVHASRDAIIASFLAIAIVVAGLMRAWP